MATPVMTVRSGNLQIKYQMIQPNSPQIIDITLNGISLAAQILVGVNSTLIGTKQYRPYADSISLDSAYKKLLFEYFDEIVVLTQTNKPLAYACTDAFFNISCNLYWELISKRGSKNLGCTFLEEICSLVNEWEGKRKRIHKGTPYYFLTFVYREMGDIDSAFASAFKAIAEDKKTFDPIFGKGNYRNAPAHKYVTIVDDNANYLYETIIELRGFLNNYIQEFQNTVNPNFSINDIDTKFLQGHKALENVAYIFVYTLELLKKHFEQMPTLPASDFYKLKNIQIIFNLCLIVDKILEQKYRRRFKRRVTNRDMYISDGVILLFDDKGWLKLTRDEKTNPRGFIGNTDQPLTDDPRTYVTDLIIRPQPINFRTLPNLTPLNTQMRCMLLAYKLRNQGAHALEKQAIFVTEYKQIIKHLMFSIFIAIEAL